MKVDNQFSKHGAEPVEVNRVTMFERRNMPPNEESVIIRFHAAKGYMNELVVRMTLSEAFRFRQDLDNLLFERTKGERPSGPAA